MCAGPSQTLAPLSMRTASMPLRPGRGSSKMDPEEWTQERAGVAARSKERRIGSENCIVALAVGVAAESFLLRYLR